MSYLLRKRKTKVAHLWTGNDTVCRMFSTGGLNPRKYAVKESNGGKQICAMCANVSARVRKKAETPFSVSSLPLPNPEKLDDAQKWLDRCMSQEDPYVPMYVRV